MDLDINRNINDINWQCPLSPVAKKEGKKKNPWSDSDGSDVEGSDLSDAMDSVEVAPRERAGGKRAAASKAKFKFVSTR